MKKIIKKAKPTNIKKTKIEIHCIYDEMFSLEDLKPHPQNRNKHGQDQIDRLAEIYKFQGIRHPIIVSKKSGFIVAGHGRRLAGMRAGLTEFPIVYQNFKDKKTEYAFVQSDNAIASWADLDLEAITMDLLNLEGLDMNMLGLKNFTMDVFTKDEKSESLKDNSSGESDPDQCPSCGYDL